MLISKMEKKQNKYCVRALAVVVFSLALTGCFEKDEAPAAPKELPVVSVRYVTLEPEDVGIETELPGRLEAFRTAEVRAQVSGVVLSRYFEEGGDVKAGESLFQIDDAPYKAALQNAQAQLAQAQASYNQSKAQVDRLKPLLNANAVSKQDYDNAVAAQKIAEANILAAKATINSAQVNMDYAKVRAPIDGTIGRAYVTEGALVAVGGQQPMAIVQDISELYVNFTRSAIDVIRLKADIDSKRYQTASDGSIPVTIILEDGTVYSEPGKLLFSGLIVDEGTGQVSLRATVPNKNGLLLPNLYVRVRLAQAKIPNAFLVPQQAVNRTERGDAVILVSPENTAQTCPVKVHGRSGENWIVTSPCLEKGSRAVMEGFMTLGPVMGMAKQMGDATGEKIPVRLDPTPFGEAKEGGQPHAAPQAAQAGSNPESAPSMETKPETSADEGESASTVTPQTDQQ